MSAGGPAAAGRAYTACPRDRFQERRPGVLRPSQGESPAGPSPVLRPRRCRSLPRPATAAARHVPLLRAAAAPRAPPHRRWGPVTSLCSRPSPGKGGAEGASPAPRTATWGVRCWHLGAAGRPARVRRRHGRKRRRGSQPTRSQRGGDPNTLGACALGWKPRSPFPVSSQHGAPYAGARRRVRCPRLVSVYRSALHPAPSARAAARQKARRSSVLSPRPASACARAFGPPGGFPLRRRLPAATLRSPHRSKRKGAKDSRQPPCKHLGACAAARDWGTGQETPLTEKGAGTRPEGRLCLPPTEYLPERGTLGTPHSKTKRHKSHEASQQRPPAMCSAHTYGPWIFICFPDMQERVRLTRKSQQNPQEQRHLLMSHQRNTISLLLPVPQETISWCRTAQQMEQMRSWRTDLLKLSPLNKISSPYFHLCTTCLHSLLQSN